MAVYTTIDDAGLFFNTLLYTGDGGTTQAQTGVGFAPDMVWVKDRSGAESHVLGTSVQGGNSYLIPNTTAAEGSLTNYLKSFDADGFTVGSGGFTGSSGDLYVGWNWKGGTTSGLSGGTITPTGYSINTTSGFGIYEYTGTNVNATIAHGLGVAPSLVIIKRITTGAGWLVQQTSLTSADYVLKLNETDAESSDSANFNGAFPDATVFSLGTSNNTNKTGDGHMAYVFAEKQGYSKVSSYTGNGNTDGTFVYTGFRPAFVMVKRINSASAWVIWDSKREGYNRDNEYLVPNTSAAGGVGTYLDILSNGFKPLTSDGEWNGSGDSYIYMAIAESPLVNSSGVPTNAR